MNNAMKNAMTENNDGDLWSVGFLLSALITLGLLLVLSVFLPAAASAESPDLDPEQVIRGAVAFQIYCAGCHGERGRVDGAADPGEEKTPPDLTRLSVRNEGSFPAEEVRRIIDGREGLPGARGENAHEMPVWGLAFQEPGRVGDQEKDVAERIDDLLVFVESLQVED